MSFYYIGQKVITTHGTVRTIAFIEGERIFAYGPRGLERITARYEAWGGEHDIEVRNVA